MPIQEKIYKKNRIYVIGTLLPLKTTAFVDFAFMPASTLQVIATIEVVTHQILSQKRNRYSAKASILWL